MTEQTADEKRSAAPAGSQPSAKPFPDFIASPPDSGAADLDMPDLRKATTTMRAPERSPVQAPVVVGPTRPPRARGVRFATFCAVVALIGAGAAIAAPSLRPLLADALRQQFGDRTWIAVVTGTAPRPPQVVEVDLQRFDERISALATALTETPSGAPVNPETLNRFVEATSDGQRLTALNDSLRRTEEQVAALSRMLADLQGSVAQTANRTDQLEAGGRAAATRTEEQVAALTKAINELQANIAQVGTRAEGLAASGNAAAARLDTAETALGDLGGRLTAVEGAGATTAARVEEQGRALAEGAAAVTAVGSRIDAVEKRVMETVDAVRTAAHGAVDLVAARVATLDEGVAGIVGRLGALEATGATAAAGIDAATQRLDTAEAALSTVQSDLRGAAEGAAALGSRLDEVGGKVAALDAGIGALDSRITTLDAKIPAIAPSTGPVLLALSTRIRTALDEGEPFPAELAAIRRYASADPAIAAAADRLAPLASQGVPGVLLLKREFNAVAKRIVEAEDAAAPYWYERQIASLQSYFGWAPPPPPPAPSGDAARAALGRAAASITAGSFAEAVTDMRTIQGPGAALAEAWVSLALLRIDAEAALRAISGGALTLLTATPG